MRYITIYATSVVSLIGVFFLGFVLFGLPSHTSSATSIAITGYAWSDTIGWISFDCHTGSATGNSICPTSNYGLVVDSITGDVSGYAWSDNIGWISANVSDFGGPCPSGTCQPKLRFSDGHLSGWLKALSGGTVGSGGWDGWISLSGTSPDYGPILQPGIGAPFQGYAWGSDVVGWVDFQYAQTGALCIPKPAVCTTDGPPPTGLDDDCGIYTCPYAGDGYGCDTGATPAVCLPTPFPTGTFTVSPRIVLSGGTVKVSWNVSDATDCTVTGNGKILWTSTNPNTSVDNPTIVNSQTIFKIHCNGIAPSFTPYDAERMVNVAPVFNER